MPWKDILRKAAKEFLDGELDGEDFASIVETVIVQGDDERSKWIAEQLLK